MIFIFPVLHLHIQKNSADRVTSSYHVRKSLHKLSKSKNNVINYHFHKWYNQQLSDFTGCGALFSLVCLLEPHLTHNSSVFILFWGFIYLAFSHLAGICVMLPAACNQKNDLMMMKYVVEVIINNSATSDSICFVAFIFLFMFFFFFLFAGEAGRGSSLFIYVRQIYK